MKTSIRICASAAMLLAFLSCGRANPGDTSAGAGSSQQVEHSSSYQATSRVNRQAVIAVEDPLSTSSVDFEDIDSISNRFLCGQGTLSITLSMAGLEGEAEFRATYQASGEAEETPMHPSSMTIRSVSSPQDATLTFARAKRGAFEGSFDIEWRATAGTTSVREIGSVLSYFVPSGGGECAGGG